MVHPQRIRAVNRKPVRPGDFVLYWMQASQRAEDNAALDYALAHANELRLPVVCCFALAGDYPEANARHFAFMLQGLAETAGRLADRGVAFVMRLGSPPEVAAGLAERAAMVVTDAGYLRHQRAWRKQLGRAVACRAVQVEADVVVPVVAVSSKAEYAARTIRPKHQKLWDSFLTPQPNTDHQAAPFAEDLGSLDPADVAGNLAALDIDKTVGPVRRFTGGRSEALNHLRAFIQHRLGEYATSRNDPANGIESHMSPYLHFGQVSPVRIARAVRDAAAPAEARDSFLEELLIRRELAMNYAWYTPKYDSYSALPAWARATLRKHKDDNRPTVYTLAQLDAADTHDEYWNAAMREMTATGKMHNYMRMYWGKKVLEWTRSPRTAYRWLRQLNNRYFLDGRDPVSYANVAWIFGLHDRPWQERAIFGTVRYMNAAGLERKFDMAGYLRRVEQLVDAEQAG
jgi:deoxyribodipyrimidine photo-lyase